MGIDRRGFIALLVGGAAGTLFTPIPWKMADDSSIWSQNWPWIPALKPGEEEFKATICKLCPSGCGILLKTIGGRPVQTLGNKDNAMSKGGICALGAAAAQLLYSPARVKQPMKREGGIFKPISWDDAQALVAEKLGAVKGQDGKAAFISGDENGSAGEVLSAFTAGLGGKYFLMPSDGMATAKAWSGMGGAGQVGYDIENADFVLAIGANVLDSWGTPVLNQKAFGAGKTAYAFIGAVQNNTAVVSKLWLPTEPGKEGVVALGVAALLIGAGATAHGAANADEFKALAASYTPDKVEQLTGVKADKLKALAEALLKAKAPVVVAGTEAGQGLSPFTFSAGMFLNMLLDRIGKKGGAVLLPAIPKVVASATKSDDLVKYLSEVEAGKAAAPEVLLTYEANPAYGLPKSTAFAKVLEKIPFKVSFSTYMDETAAMSDVILPAPSFLERADDAQTPFGAGAVYYAACKPACKPVADVKSTPDVVLELAKTLDLELGFGKFVDVLKAKAEKVGASFDDLAKKGKAYYEAKLETSGAVKLVAPVKAAGEELPVAVAAVARQAFGPGYLATPPFNIQVIRDDELFGKDIFIQVNKATAAKLGVALGQKVRVENGAGGIAAKVNVTETVADGVIAVPMGLGRTAWDEFTKDKGDNALKLLAVNDESGFVSWSASRAKIAKI